MSEEKGSWKLQAHERRELLVELAKGEVLQAELARRYGVSQAAITQFKNRFENKIQGIREELGAGIEEKLAGMWIAKKENRIAHIMDIADKIDNSLAESVDKEDSVLLKVKIQALRQAAEELGQLTQFVESKNVSYTIEGVDPKDLK